LSASMLSCCSPPFLHRLCPLPSGIFPNGEAVFQVQFSASQPLLPPSIRTFVPPLRTCCRSSPLAPSSNGARSVKSSSHIPIPSLRPNRCSSPPYHLWDVRTATNRDTPPVLSSSYYLWLPPPMRIKTPTLNLSREQLFFYARPCACFLSGIYHSFCRAIFFPLHYVTYPAFGAVADKTPDFFLPPSTPCWSPMGTASTRPLLNPPFSHISPMYRL